MLYWGEIFFCVRVSYIMLCSSGIKLVLEAGRSLELEAADPAIGLLITTHTPDDTRTKTLDKSQKCIDGSWIIPELIFIHRYVEQCQHLKEVSADY